MDLLERPYEGAEFVVNIEGSDLQLIMDAIDAIPDFDTEKICICTGVGTVGASRDVLSVWVSDEDPVLMRNRIYQAMLRVATEDYRLKGEIFDGDNHWHTIFKEANILGMEWNAILSEVIKKYETGHIKCDNIEDEPEYIVATDLKKRYGEEFEKHPNRIYGMYRTEGKDWVDREECGWDIVFEGLRVSESDPTRVYEDNDDGDDEEYYDEDIPVDYFRILG